MADEGFSPRIYGKLSDAMSKQRPSAKEAENMMTVKDVAERFGVKEHAVLLWINSGELKAIDVRRHMTTGERPRWRISEAALQAFEELRTKPLPPERTERRKRSAEVVEFYK